jgi:histidine triad (HIT) family protein
MEAPMADHCIFCKIINKKLPAKLVHEDDQLIVFMDINPQAPSHMLIVPKIHINSLNELQPEHAQLLGHAVFVAKDIAKEWGIADGGWRLVANCGDDAGQSVYHVHFHMLGGKQMSGHMA